MGFEMKPFFNMEPSDLFKDVGRQFFDQFLAQVVLLQTSRN